MNPLRSHGRGLIIEEFIKRRPSAIEKIVDEVLAANAAVEEFRAGKDKAFNALVGRDEGHAR